jgi:spore germination protein (amino acid permease)
MNNGKGGGSLRVNIRHQVSPYHMFFIIVASQIGLGVLGFHRIIAKYAGYDAWISVLISGAVIQFIIWIMFQLLTAADGDILEVHKQMYGKKVGSIISSVLMIYFWMAAVSVLRGYIEIIQVWMFPTLPTWVLSILILILCYYIISGGFRVVVGMSFTAVLLTLFFILFLFHLPHQYVHFDNLLPILDHSFIDLLKSAKATSYSMAGFEILLMVFPFIKNVKASQKFAHLGILFTTSIYTLSAITAFLFVNKRQLDHTIWARIYILKLIRFSFLERFEYILIPLYMVNIVAILVLMLWASSRGFKVIFNIKQKYSLIVILIVSFVLSQFFENLYTLNRFIDIISRISVDLFYIYIPLLWLVFILVKKRTAK